MTATLALPNLFGTPRRQAAEVRHVRSVMPPSSSGRSVSYWERAMSLLSPGFNKSDFTTTYSGDGFVEWALLREQYVSELAAQSSPIGDWILETIRVDGRAGVESTPSQCVVDSEWIKKALGLSMSDLAILLRVSRKTLYSWFDGTHVPQAAPANRVAGLREFFEGCDARELKFLRQLWSYVQDGQSLLDILKLVDAPGSPHIETAKKVFAQHRPKLASLVARSETPDRKYNPKIAYDESFYRSVSLGRAGEPGE